MLAQWTLFRLSLLTEPSGQFLKPLVGTRAEAGYSLVFLDVAVVTVIPNGFRKLYSFLD